MSFEICLLIIFYKEAVNTPAAKANIVYESTSQTHDPHNYAEPQPYAVKSSAGCKAKGWFEFFAKEYL